MLVLGLLAGCGVSSELTSTVELSVVRAPGAPPSYWLGEQFEGLPLTANAGTAERPTFVYGT